MSECKINAKISIPELRAATYPTGPRGIGIKEIIQQQNTLTFVFDDDKENTFNFPNWWFGTREEYNALNSEEKTAKELYFIQEGT